MAPGPHGVMAAAWTLLAGAGIFVGLRFYCKSFRGAKFSLDDWVLFASWVATMINCVFVTVNVNLPPPPPNGPPEAIASALRNIALYSSVSVTFAICAQSWSKVSFGLTLIPLCQGWLRRFVWTAIILINVFFGLGGLFQWIPCKPLRKAWEPTVPGTCWPANFNANWGIFVSAFSGGMDLCFALIPWKIILSLQMNKREKLGIAFAMSLGIIAAVAAFIKCYYLNDLRLGRTPSPMLAIFGVAEPALTIIAASVPFLRVLIKHVASTHDYYLSDYGADNTNRSGGNNNNSKFSQRRTMVSASRKPRVSEPDAGDTGSDKSILDHPAAMGGAGQSGVLRTKVFEVSYETRQEGGDHDAAAQERHDKP